MKQLGQLFHDDEHLDRHETGEKKKPKKKKNPQQSAANMNVTSNSNNKPGGPGGPSGGSGTLMKMNIGYDS